MNFRFVRKGIVIVTIVSAVLIPVPKSAAATVLDLAKQETKTVIDANCLVDAAAEIRKQENTEKTIQIETPEETRFNDKMSKLTFVRMEEEYLLVTETPQEESDWVGKVFANSTVEIVEKEEGWAHITSGNVDGYVKTENLIVGKDAVERAKELLTAEYPETDVFSLTEEETEKAFSVGESKEEEQARLQREEEQRIAEQKAKEEAARVASLKKGQSVVDYAAQFQGNPYVYGGTSLTNGTDCSGFVKGVYAHFGVSLPRTSYAMRNVGRAVSYSEMQPGDIVCYEGHVGIYAGNGQNINAIDEARGIGFSNTTHRRIVTIRRVF